MNFVITVLLVITPIFSKFSHLTTAQELEAVLCDARLPIKLNDHTAVYDGDDSIYIFGGREGSTDSLGIYKYSISSDSITSAGTLPTTSNRGGGVMGSEGNIILTLGGRTEQHKDVYSYNTKTENFTKISTLSEYNDGFATIKLDENTLLNFAGSSSPSTIVRIDLATNQSAVIAEMRVSAWRVSAIYIEDTGVAYVFTSNSFNRNITKYIPSTNSAHVLQTNLVQTSRPHQAVWSGKNGYIVGINSPDLDSGHILQFDIGSETLKTIPVRGDPIWTTRNVSHTAAVYIPKVNSIYIFGGYREGGGFEQSIWSISLDPIEPPPTSSPSPIPSTTTASSTTTTGDPITTTSDPVVGEPCQPYPGDVEEPFPFPHTGNNASTQCGEYLYATNAGIIYKPSQAALPHERCIWTIATPDATAYKVTIHIYGYEPNQNNEEGHGLIISDFGMGRAPRHFIPTTKDTTTITNTSLIFVTFFSAEVGENQGGFMLEYEAIVDLGMGSPSNPNSKHYLVGSEQYALRHNAIIGNELSSFVFLPKDNIYQVDKHNRVIFLDQDLPSCDEAHLKVYFFNTTCIGPYKWQYNGRMCPETTAELILSPEPILIVFESTVETDGGLYFVYSNNVFEGF